MRCLNCHATPKSHSYNRSGAPTGETSLIGASPKYAHIALVCGLRKMLSVIFSLPQECGVFHGRCVAEASLRRQSRAKQRRRKRSPGCVHPCRLISGESLIKRTKIQSRALSSHNGLYESAGASKHSRRVWGQAPVSTCLKTGVGTQIAKNGRL